MFQVFISKFSLVFFAGQQSTPNRRQGILTCHNTQRSYRYNFTISKDSENEISNQQETFHNI